MTDCELLELAAKAAGIDWFDEPAAKQGRGLHLKSGRFWNPIADDGDALRLAVKLGISITPYPIYQPEKHSVIAKQRRVSDTMREANPSEVLEMYGKDPYAATRRAIVRAAAEIGRSMA